jgi:hypothetical protein
MPSIQSFEINKSTSLIELNNFLAKVDNPDHLHAKLQKDGETYLLYVSKGSGKARSLKNTGFKNTLFPQTIQNRRANARAAILKVAKKGENTRANVGLRSDMQDGLFEKMGEFSHLKGEYRPLVAERVKEKVSDAVGAEVARDFERLGLVFSDGEPSIGEVTLSKHGKQAFDRIIQPSAVIPYRAFQSMETAGEKIHNLLTAGLHGSNDDIKKAAQELEPLRKDLIKASKDGKMFADEDFIKSYDVKSDENNEGNSRALRQLGKDLTTVSTELSQHDNQFSAVLRLVDAALSSPEIFASNLKKCQALADPAIQLPQDLRSIESNFIDGAAHKLHSSFNEELKQQLDEAIGLGGAVYHYIETPYIKNPALERLPFESEEVFDKLIDLSSNSEEHAIQYLEAIRKGAKNLNKDELIELSEKMTRDLAILKYGSELFTNEDFISKSPPYAQKVARTFGRHLTELYKVLAEPDGVYFCLSRMTQQARDVPVKFTSAWDQNMRDPVAHDSLKGSRSSEDASQLLI